MATYAIGDLQGCADAFDRLLDALHFDPARDRLWLVGDLVNRGHDSLGTLQRIMRLGPAVQAILGNHDLNLLAVHHGLRQQKPRDTLGPILAHPERDAIIEWLAACPLTHDDADLGWGMVHAGVPAGWNWTETRTRAAAVETLLRDADTRPELLESMYGNQPTTWQAATSDIERLRFTINSLTRMRCVTADGALDFSHDGPPEEIPDGLQPWYSAPLDPSIPPLVTGHWAAAGARSTPRALLLDSGCVWGQGLTAARIDATRDPFACPLRRVACDDH